MGSYNIFHIKRWRTTTCLLINKVGWIISVLTTLWWPWSPWHDHATSMTAMPWSCYISWWPWQDLTMIIPWRVWITMIIACHSMIVMFDHGCQPGHVWPWLSTPADIQCWSALIQNISSSVSALFITWKPLNSTDSAGNSAENEKFQS